MTKSAFAQRLIELTHKAGLTLADLARESSVPYHQIHTWTRREHAVPNAKSLQDVARVLDVTEGFLLNGEPLPDQSSETHKQLLQELSVLSEEELRILLAAAEAMRAGRDQQNG